MPPEAKIHGQPSFPYTVYKGNVPGFFPFYPLHWHEEMDLNRLLRPHIIHLLSLIHI